MSESWTALAVLFWACALLVVYAYVGYPSLVWWLARRSGPAPARPAWSDAAAPPVTLLIAAHNEEGVIARRLENVLASQFPADRLRVVVASDGSTDRTDAVVRGYAPRGVRLLAYPQRGKAATLNAGWRSSPPRGGRTRPRSWSSPTPARPGPRTPCGGSWRTSPTPRSGPSAATW